MTRMIKASRGGGSTFGDDHVFDMWVAAEHITTVDAHEDSAGIGPTKTRSRSYVRTVDGQFLIVDASAEDVIAYMRGEISELHPQPVIEHPQVIYPTEDA